MSGGLDGGRALAPFHRRRLTVAGVEDVGPYRLLRVADPDGPVPSAGQFAMLAALERWGAGEEGRPYLPRAFSFARFKDGEAQFLLADVGPGTHRLGELEPGEGLWVLGPLGNGFTAPPSGSRALLVGGGIGIAPLLICQDQLEGRPVSVLLGFRSAEHAGAAELLEGAQLASDDGSLGHHGPVTELLAAELERAEDPPATVYACGPPPMLEAVRAICHAGGASVQLALEAGMACGFGACYGCVVPSREGSYLRVCVDGPVIEGSRLARVVDPAHEPRAAVPALPAAPEPALPDLPWP